MFVILQGKIEMQGSYKDLGNTDGIYAQLLAQEQELPYEEKEILSNSARTMRQQSVRVFIYLFIYSLFRFILSFFLTCILKYIIDKYLKIIYLN